MILRILYGCGTRLGETLALRRKDVDFKAHTIFLQNTKFSKERLIPVHETLINILERYCLTLGIMLSPDAYLFPGARPERPFTKRQMGTWFAEIDTDKYMRFSGAQIPESLAAFETFTAGLIPKVEVPYEEE